jgi:anti-sigma factor RsiW
MTDAQHISPDDLALYALEALAPDAAAMVREHVAACDVCRDELARLNGDLAMLALSVDQQPLPSGARERFAQRIAGERHLDSPVNKPAQPVIVNRTPKAVRAGWAGWLAAAAILVVAVTLGFEVGHLQNLLDNRDSKIAALEAGKSRAEQVVEVLTAPTAQRVLLTAAKTPPAPTAHVVYLPSRGGLILQANNLSPVPDGKTYELWVIPADGSSPIPAGLFRPDAAGNGSVVLPAIPTGLSAKAFGVTVENSGGSRTPTAPILLAGAVPASGE